MTFGDGEEPGPRPGEVFRLAASLYLLVAVVGLAWIGARRGELTLDLFLDPSRWLLHLTAGIAVAVGVAGLWEPLRRVAVARELEGRLQAALGRLGADEVLGLALVSGLSEEVLFRGAVQSAWGFWPATALFALCHAGRGRAMRLWTVSAFAAGAALGGLYAWSGALLAPVTAHVLINAIGLYRLQSSGPTDR